MKSIKEVLAMGIDPSKRGTAYVILKGGHEVVAQKRLETKENKKLSKLENAMSDLKEIYSFIHSALIVNTPDVIAIEGYSFAGVANLTSQAEVTGVILMAIVKYNNYLKKTKSSAPIPIMTRLQPTQVKKYLTGKGTGKKQLMLKEVYKKFAFDCEDDNIADAFVISKMAFEVIHLIQEKKFRPGIKEFQKQIFEKNEEVSDIIKSVKILEKKRRSGR